MKNLGVYFLGSYWKIIQLLPRFILQNSFISNVRSAAIQAITFKVHTLKNQAKYFQGSYFRNQTFYRFISNVHIQIVAFFWFHILQIHFTSEIIMAISISKTSKKSTFHMNEKLLVADFQKIKVSSWNKEAVCSPQMVCLKLRKENYLKKKCLLLEIRV